LSQVVPFVRAARASRRGSCAGAGSVCACVSAVVRQQSPYLRPSAKGERSGPDARATPDLSGIDKPIGRKALDKRRELV
jgi:hypothetical protein